MTAQDVLKAIRHAYETTGVRGFAPGYGVLEGGDADLQRRALDALFDLGCVEKRYNTHVYGGTSKSSVCWFLTDSHFPRASAVDPIEEVARLRETLSKAGNALAEIGLRAVRSWRAKGDGEIVLDELLTLEAVAGVLGVAARTTAERASGEKPFVGRVEAKCRAVLDEAKS